MSESLRSTLRMELVDLLPRLRQTLPFPLEPEKVYMGAFPSQMGRWFWERVPSDLQLYSVAYRNLMRIAARQEIIHFNITAPSAIDDWKEVNPDQPFWIRVTDSPVCPSSKLTPFLLEESVRTDPSLQKWYRDAERLDVEIRYFADKIYAVAPLFANRTDVALAWPEVVQAVPAIISGLRTSLAGQLRRATRIEGIREKIDHRIPPNEMARLTEMLATATLLPSNVQLTAWIGTNKEDQ